MRNGNYLYLLFVVIVALLLTTQHAWSGVITGPIYNPTTQHYYSLLTQSNWVDAEIEADSLGGYLLTINDIEEQEWVLEQFSPNRDLHLWLGLNDVVNEGSFVWDNGDLLSFDNFPVGEPNNHGGNEDYVYIDVAHGDAWNDLANRLEQIAPGGFFIPIHGVVEFEVTPVPEPSTLWLLGIGMFIFSARRLSLV